jgi:hypothetical protein
MPPTRSVESTRVAADTHNSGTRVEALSLPATLGQKGTATNPGDHPPVARQDQQQSAFSCVRRSAATLACSVVCYATTMPSEVARNVLWRERDARVPRDASEPIARERENPMRHLPTILALSGLVALATIGCKSKSEGGEGEKKSAPAEQQAPADEPTAADEPPAQAADQAGADLDEDEAEDEEEEDEEEEDEEEE